MAKTCRTCGFCYPRYGCSEAKMPLDCITTDHSCSAHKPRETPLLVDELGDVLAIVWKRRYTDGDEAGVTPGYTIRLTPNECDVVRAALARHQKEVGDA